MIRRKIDRILSEGEGRQLTWLASLVVILFGLFCLIGSFWALGWEDIFAVLIDPGNFPIEGHKIFSLIIALCSLLVLNALTVSAFSNMFDNISSKYRRGESRYRLKGHLLILGGGRHLSDMLAQMRSEGLYAGKDIVIMTSSDVEQLRAEVETALDDKRFCSRLLWYRGDRSNADDLRSACAANACCIYLIGEDNEEAHDSVNIASMDILGKVCGTSGPRIPCYLTIDCLAGMQVMNCLGNNGDSRLDMEIVSTSDYLVEQLLVNTDFLPLPADGQRLRIIIDGNSNIADSFATVASQICHFPEYAKSGKRTVITFVGDGMRSRMDEFVSCHQDIFDLSHYAYISSDCRVEYAPKAEYGDFLDIEWEFVEGGLNSEFVRESLVSWVADSGQTMAVALCGGDSASNLSAALHLPSALRKASVPVAVYQKEHPELVEKAVSSGQFGSLVCFGEAAPGSDALFLRRSAAGKRVNFLYAKEYGNPPATDADKAWASLSCAHKISSIASANSIPMKLRVFGIKAERESVASLDADALESLSEVEHRRWMSTVLLMGYHPATVVDRADRSRFKELKTKEFVHLDIAPYAELFQEADKDRIIIQNITFIVNGL